MKGGIPGPFGTKLKALREAAGFTQEELATIAGLSVHAVSALERGERRRPHLETLRALSAALDLNSDARDALVASARPPVQDAAADELSGASLAIPPTALVGREAEVRTLRHWLDDPSARLITLVGPGGVGKTRLALDLARTVAEHGATRVIFVELAAIREPSFVAPAIAEALGLADVTAADFLRRAQGAADAGRPTLLVLDNCEQVLDTAPLVADLLSATPSIRLLATSRAPLRVRGEREYVVGPLALPTNPGTISPADLALAPAVRLFVERVREVYPHFRLTSANGPIVAAICRRLDALPLALELAASRIKVMTADDLLRQLERDVLLPSSGPRDLPARQRTMAATVAWSYQLLGSAEQRAFRRFAALPGRFSIEAAAAVLVDDANAGVDDEAALAAVAALIDQSLLQRADTAASTRPLYRMLDTVRAYGSVQLDVSGERGDALDGLARYCTNEAAVAEHELIGLAQIEWLNRVREDLDNYRGALKWCIDGQRSIQAANIAWGLMFFWLIRGRAAEGLQWYERILTLPALSPEAEARSLVGAAVMSFTLGECERARGLIERALMLARAIGDTTVIAHAENLLGHVEQTSGHLDAAADLFAGSVNAFHSLSTPWGAGNALIGLAGIAIARGDADRAEDLLDEATSVLRRAGPWFLNLPLYVRAILAVRRGHADAAIGLVRESLVCSRALHDRFAFVYALVPLAAAAILKDDHAWAARILGTRDAVTERIGTTIPGNAVRDLRESTERAARERLGLEAWTATYAAGRSASIDSLLTDIDRIPISIPARQAASPDSLRRFRDSGDCVRTT